MIRPLITNAITAYLSLLNNRYGSQTSINTTHKLKIDDCAATLKLITKFSKKFPIAAC